MLGIHDKSLMQVLVSSLGWQSVKFYAFLWTHVAVLTTQSHGSEKCY